MNDITIMLLIVEEAKEIILYFSQGTVKVLGISLPSDLATACSAILFLL